MRLKIYSYNTASESAGLLADALDIYVLRRHNSRYRPRTGDVIINWGSGSIPEHLRHLRIINKPQAVNRVRDKLSFFRNAQGGDFNVPEWTTDPEVAATWPRSFARTTTTSHSGRGIVITRRGERPPTAPLYTRGIAKDREFRIYVAFGEVIDSLRKIARPGTIPTNWAVRSYDNGFIFARNSGQPSEATKAAAIAAVSHYGLDFGGVDIAVTEEGVPYVFEINTAPGIEGTSVTNFATAFRQELLGA